MVEDKEQQYVIVVESQSNPDRDISYRWPYYVTYLHNKYKCPVVLLVVTSSDETARWARKRTGISMDEGLVQLVPVGAPDH